MSDLETVSGPEAEPLELDVVKSWRRVDGSGSDDDLTAMIAGARAEVESFTRLRLITQTVRLTFPAFPKRIAIPVWPVQSVGEIRYIDEAGVEQTLASSAYTLVKGRKPREIAPAYGTTWPTTRAHWNAVEVDVVVGFGATGADVPPDILTAMRLIIGTRDEHREDAVVGTVTAKMPVTARDLLLPHVLY